MPIFIVFGLTHPGIQPRSTVSVADALSIHALIGASIDPSLAKFDFLTSDLEDNGFHTPFY